MSEDKLYPDPFGDEWHPDDFVFRVRVKVQRIHPDAVIPKRKTEGAAAYDVYAAHKVELQPGETTIVGTGLKMELPAGYDLKVLPRSGFSLKGVTVRNSPGLIDEDYRGEICIILKYEPENLCSAVSKLYKALFRFTKNLVSSVQFNLDVAKKELANQVNVKLFEPYIINQGDRIAQIQLSKVECIEFEEVDELGSTERGEGGFGSTGK